VIPPKRDNVSEPEMEFVTVLNHDFPGQFITAFSSDQGQERISKPGCATVIPDAVGIGAQKGHVHFFNGCW
jgi:hypothetical protein